MTPEMIKELEKMRQEDRAPKSTLVELHIPAPELQEIPREIPVKEEIITRGVMIIDL